MQKLRFFFLLVLLPNLLLAQQRTKIILQGSSQAKVDTKTNITYVKNPIFRQDNAILTCDSAVFYTERNFFEAYKNVHINQGDTVNIFSDFLDYDGNAKMAHLNSNVRMVDPTSVLTTNVLDYNMNTRIGTYTDGGKIVNKEGVTLTSKKGWYFAFSKDAFFRYNVVVVTPQSVIKSDTLRYNTLSSWTYFYGPTNIKGKDDNLYTENGLYNTKSENAYFDRNNLYTNGSRSLKGDSLYYYGKKGYAKAVRNIVYIDTSDKTVMRGQLGEYYKADERVLVTKNAYVGIGTDDSVMVGNKKVPDTLWLGADSLEAQKSFVKNIKLLNKPIIEKDNEVGAEDEKAKEEKEKEKAAAKKEMANAKLSNKAVVPTESPKKLSRKERKEAEQKAKDTKNTSPPKLLADSILLTKAKLRLDSIRQDSLLNVQQQQAQIKAKDSLKTAQKMADSLKKITVAGKKPVTVDPKAKAVAANKANPAGKTGKDSVAVFNPADTVTARVIKAYHNVRVYKSNMQAIADSLYYTSADSVLRWYKNPILWSDGSQQTGDTINVFFKNKKTHSFQVLQNAFIVNLETDTTKFNQVKGKKITGFFQNGELRDMYVDGNAESMYYNKDKNGNYDNLNQTVSGRIKFRFADKELSEVTIIKKNEGTMFPIDKMPKEPLLTGFIWKPELRPRSKADVIKGRPKPKATPKTAPADKSKTGDKNKGVDPSGVRPILPAKKPVASATPKEAGQKPAPLGKSLELEPVKTDTGKVILPKKG